jgi:hypothetical protein
VKQKIQFWIACKPVSTKPIYGIPHKKDALGSTLPKDKF